MQHLSEHKFKDKLHSVLSPSRPIQSVEYLRGRAVQLNEIRKAFYSPGRQVFIHGYRGVGKTSVAQSAAYQNQSSDASPVMIACDHESNFFRVIHDVVVNGLSHDPLVHKRALDASANVNILGFSASLRDSLERGKVPIPESMNEAINLMRFFAQQHSKDPIVVIDEFDLLHDYSEQTKFADFIKQIADQAINVKFIFCGIGASIDDLFRAHASAHRYFHTVKLDRLPWEARFEIIDVASKELEITVDDTTRIRIAKISDGFPHYVHLLCEKLFWLVYECTQDGIVTPDLFGSALNQAVDAMEPYLKQPYEKATRKYTNTYEEILWAVADTHELVRASTEIYKSYQRIMNMLTRTCLDRTRFNNRMNRLKQEEHAHILTGSRSGWYEFTEKIHRGFARLRAQQSGVELEVEHPAQGRRFGG